MWMEIYSETRIRGYRLTLEDRFDCQTVVKRWQTRWAHCKCGCLAEIPLNYRNRWYNFLLELSWTYKFLEFIFQPCDYCLQQIISIVIFIFCKIDGMFLMQSFKAWSFCKKLQWNSLKGTRLILIVTPTWLKR